MAVSAARTHPPSPGPEPRPARWPWLGRVLVALVVAGHLLFLVQVAGELTETGYRPRLDFTVFWGAARLALAGEAAAAFDWQVLERAQGVAPGGSIYYWYYPPHLHLLVVPFGLLPYLAAYGLFTFGGLVLFALALRRWSRSRAWVALGSPAVLFALVTGNVSLYWAAALLAACRLLGSPARAGVLFAAMTAKPQLGLMIPVALGAAGAWRVVAWSAVWTALIAAATLPVFGAGYWALFLENLAGPAGNIARQASLIPEMMTWYAFALRLGLPAAAALGLQLAATLLAAWAVAVAWRRPDPPFRMAVLCLAIPLSTPYGFPYELVFAAAAAMFLVEGGRARGRAGLGVVLLLWSLPLWWWFIPGLKPADYLAPALGLVLAWLMLTGHGARAG